MNQFYKKNLNYSLYALAQGGIGVFNGFRFPCKTPVAVLKWLHGSGNQHSEERISGAR